MKHKHDWKAVAKKWRYLGYPNRGQANLNATQWRFTITWACPPPCGQVRQTSTVLPLDKP